MAKDIAQGYSYKVLPINIAAGLNEVEFNYNGSLLYYLSGNTEIKVRINSPEADQIPLRQSQQVIFPITKLFISCAASPETIRLLVFHPSTAMFRGEEMIIASAVDTLTNITKIGGTAQTGYDSGVAIPNIQYALNATTPTLYNLVCTLAATEYSQALPANTRRFTVKARGADLKVCFTNGESATKYILLADGASFSEDGMNLTGKTIYVQSPNAGTVAEILAWTRS